MGERHIISTLVLQCRNETVIVVVLVLLPVVVVLVVVGATPAVAISHLALLGGGGLALPTVRVVAVVLLHLLPLDRNLSIRICCANSANNANNL